MKTRFVAAAFLGLIFSGCGSSDSSLSPPDDQPKGHALHLAANLKEANGELSFMTASASIIKVPASEIIGKPYLIGAYPAGFSPGNDPALHSTWGDVPADLKIQYTTPATYKDGAYDMVLVVYLKTPITDVIRATPIERAPAARNGDLATFTLDMSPVRPGDAPIAPGTVRFNVEGGDTHITVENKTATEVAQVPAALANTVMIVP